MIRSTFSTAASRASASVTSRETGWALVKPAASDLADSSVRQAGTESVQSSDVQESAVIYRL